MKKITFLIITLLFCFNSSVKADDTCSSSEMARLRNLADKIEFTYDYEWNYFDDENDGIRYEYPIFTINATNLNKELKVIIKEDYYNGKYQEFINQGNGVGKMGGFRDGARIAVTIRAYTADSCSGKIIKVKNIDLPILNLRYYQPICQENLNFKYCARFMDKNITDDQFYEELAKWETGNNTDKSNDDNIIVEESSHFFIVIIVVAFIAIVGIGIFIGLKKKKNDL